MIDGINPKLNNLRRRKMRQAIPSKEQGGLNQVWMQLSCEQQVGVIQVMAELVLKLIVAQFEINQKDVCDE
jgi:hypothetical protein